MVTKPVRLPKRALIATPDRIIRTGVNPSFHAKRYIKKAANIAPTKAAGGTKYAY